MAGGRLCVVFCVVAALALAGAAGADTSPPAVTSGLAVLGDAHTFGAVLGLPDGAPPTAAITFYVPAGYTVSSSAAPGAELGVILEGSGFFPDLGTLVAADASGAGADPLLATCAPGAHLAVWEPGTGPSFGTPAPVRLVVDPTSGAETALGAYRIQVCLPAADYGTAKPIATLGFVLEPGVIAAPTQTGTYLWHALVSPFASDGVTADATQTKDYQSALPWPTSVSLKNAYQPKTHIATLSGTVTMAGSPPPAGTGVDVVALAKGTKLVAGTTAHTAVDGSFHARLRITQTVTIDATPQAYLAPCTTTAPGGCVGNVTSNGGAELRLVVKPPKKKKR